MEKNIPILLQEIVFASSSSSLSKQISKLERTGLLKKLSPRIYSGNLNESPEKIIHRNLFYILGHLYPGAVLSHRSAFEFKPSAGGQIFLTYTYTKKVTLPGITVRLMKGEKSLPGDNPLVGELYVSQKERALLENLQNARKSNAESKNLSKAEIEERLEQVIRVNGEAALNDIRDKAKSIADTLNMQKEFEKLSKLISAMLRTKSANILKSPLAAARAFGIPYDAARYQLFTKLFEELNQFEFKYVEDKNAETPAFERFAFFESYFSNYIEGTKFGIEQAKQIIETQKPLPSRDLDSHDVLGTYQIVANKKEMLVVPKTADALLDILKYRHKIMLAARSDVNPGEFKNRNNFAGETEFVDKTLVRGTLIKSFEFYNALPNPFAKAAYLMFVVSEVHPFLDGNGRIARIMMNAELVQGQQARILIPTVYREDYILTLRKLTRKGEPDAFIRMLNKIQQYSAMITGISLEDMQVYLTNTNAFLESDEGIIKF